MSFNIARHLRRPASSPQNEPIPGREADMSINGAGGVAFDVSDGDPADPLTLQCVGLDATLLEIIRSFVAAEL